MSWIERKSNKEVFKQLKKNKKLWNHIVKRRVQLIKLLLRREEILKTIAIAEEKINGKIPVGRLWHRQIINCSRILTKKWKGMLQIERNRKLRQTRPGIADQNSILWSIETEISHVFTASSESIFDTLSKHHFNHR